MLFFIFCVLVTLIMMAGLYFVADDKLARYYVFVYTLLAIIFLSLLIVFNLIVEFA